MTFISNPNVCQNSHTLWWSPDFQTSTHFCPCQIQHVSAIVDGRERTGSALAQGNNLPRTNNSLLISISFIPQQCTIKDDQWFPVPANPNESLSRPENGEIFIFIYLSLLSFVFSFYIIYLRSVHYIHCVVFWEPPPALAHTTISHLFCHNCKESKANSFHLYSSHIFVFFMMNNKAS